MKSAHFTHQQATDLLHNKFVVVLGDSIQRGVYKDIVLLLQRDKYLESSQLKTKGEEVFENDELLEGGKRGKMTNGTEYREVRQYTSDHHLVRFYFITRIFSDYVQTIFEEFEDGLKPDLVIVNSCVWDVSRYGRLWEADYLENLTTFFRKLRSILPEDALIIWNMTMPLGEKIIGGFLVPEIAEFGPSLRFDIVEANYCSATLANTFGLDVLDLHFQFRFSLQHRMRDGVHWNAVAHRRITCLLLAHIANAWGVHLPPSQPPTGLNQSFSETNPAIREIHMQPRKAQNQVISWRPRERWANYHPVPATPWMSPRYYAEGFGRWVESPDHEGHYGSWTRGSYVQGPVVGRGGYSRCHMDQHPYRQPYFSNEAYSSQQHFSRDYLAHQTGQAYDQDFSKDYVPPRAGQSHGDQGYKRRKKYSKHGQYRPY
ncbi:hypothetical protein ACEWY4_024604 [Coilia grayii]|uniref:PC-esterase domain-containing protein 1A n=1 Tax=Coilia grayii TaxID=363190 RepID=A0ABD1IV61_9TELE